MSLRVERALGLVLRLGPAQPGMRAFGVPPGGPFDRAAAATARQAAGALPDATVLELANAVVEARLESSTILAWAGAAAAISVDGTAVPAGVPYAVREGAKLTVAPAPTGLRTYLAVAGGFGEPPLEAQWVRAGDVLPFGPHPNRPAIAVPAIPTREGPIRVVPGPEAALFPNGWLVKAEWTVSPQSNRVGVRLEGPPTTPAPEMVSEPACFGTIQVDASGLPILLGPDGPTIGGYAKVAVVRDADLDRLAQLLPGEAVRFSWA